MSYEFDVRPVPVQLVIYQKGTCRHEDVGRLCRELLPAIYTYLRESGEEVGGPPYCRFAAWREEDCDIEAGFPLLNPVHGEGKMRIGQVGGGKALHTMHKGPYDTLREAHDACRAWMEREGKMSAGAPWEVYLTDPALFPDPNDWMTELFYPVR